MGDQPDMKRFHGMLQNTDFGNLRFVRKKTYRLNCNWKVFVDNYLGALRLKSFHVFQKWRHTKYHQMYFRNKWLLLLCNQFPSRRSIVYSSWVISFSVRFTLSLSASLEICDPIQSNLSLFQFHLDPLIAIISLSYAFALSFLKQVYCSPDKPILTLLLNFLHRRRISCTYRTPGIIIENKHEKLQKRKLWELLHPTVR